MNIRYTTLAVVIIAYMEVSSANCQSNWPEPTAMTKSPIKAVINERVAPLLGGNVICKRQQPVQFRATQESIGSVIVEHGVA